MYSTYRRNLFFDWLKLHVYSRPEDKEACEEDVETSDEKEGSEDGEIGGYFMDSESQSQSVFHEAALMKEMTQILDAGDLEI